MFVIFRKRSNHKVNWLLFFSSWPFCLFSHTFLFIERTKMLVFVIFRSGHEINWLLSFYFLLALTVCLFVFAYAFVCIF